MMNIGRYIILVSLLFVLAISAEAQQKELSAKLAGKWSGTIQSEMKAFGTKGEIIVKGKSSLEILDLSVKEYEEREPSAEEIKLAKISGFAPIVTSFTGWAKFSALTEYFDSRGRLSERWSLPNKVELIEVDGHFMKDNTLFISSDFEVLMKQEQWLPEPFGYTVQNHPDWDAFSMGGSPLFPTRGIKFKLEKGAITIDDIWKEGGGEIKVTGELCRIEFLKRVFPKDIKPNEPIKTDKKTRIEVTLPDVGKMNIAQNSNAVFRSHNLLEVAKGVIHVVVPKLKPKTKFEVHTPTSTTGVRGTEYTLIIDDDGKVTVIVISGETQVSDKRNRKTVIVKKNQQSVIEPQGLPSEPISVKPKRIPKWWE